MLRKDLLRVSRRADSYQPEFIDESARPLAARVLGTFQGHVGESWGQLEDALTELEREAADYKLVRGFAALLERDAKFETRAPLPPERTRKAVFRAGESVGVATEEQRAEAIELAADSLGVTSDTIETAMFADRDNQKQLVSFTPRWGLDELLNQYNLSLAATALFDATEVTVRSSDPKSVITAAKRLGLMYEIRRRKKDISPDSNLGRREVIITGPNALFRQTRRYGTAFARLLRTVARAAEWELTAIVDDRGRQRELVLTDDDVTVPGVDPVVEPAFDSDIEADFATRFRALDLDWDLVREPEPLAVSRSDDSASLDGEATGTGVMIPDFAFEYRYADFRVFFEIMGFWTPEYIEKKLHQLAHLEGVEMVVAVDESLGVGDAITERDHTVIIYSERVEVKDIVDILREYEAELGPAIAERLPKELRPDVDAMPLEQLADEHGVPPEALRNVEFPEHELVGSTIVRPELLERIRKRLQPGMEYETATNILTDYSLGDTSALLTRLGFRVEWSGLTGGVLRRRD